MLLSLVFSSVVAYNQMNHYIKARTNLINCEGSLKTLSILEEMFPLHPAQDADISEALQKYFDEQDPQHLRYLQQCCFKAPLASLSKVYNNFREQRFPNVGQLQISSYFPNESFVRLSEVEKWLDGQSEYPSKGSPEVIKQDIADVLLSLTEQFGYIPNLQRFLLYFPAYLLKVQKFKARFFEQVIEQTSEVTYLSPKNCCFAGLIAAIEAGSPYMMGRMANMFLVRGGNPDWITKQKYPEQFRPLFGLFRKISVSPSSISELDMSFSYTVWGAEVYFDLITAGMFVLSMSTISLAMGLVPDQPCKLLPLAQLLSIKCQYNKVHHKSMTPRSQILLQLRCLLKSSQPATKQKVQQIQSRQIQSYMKQIGIMLNSCQLYRKYNQIMEYIGVPAYFNVNDGKMMKNNGFFYRYRDVIEKGLQESRKGGRLRDSKFQSFKNYCLEGSMLALSMPQIQELCIEKNQKGEQNPKLFWKMLEMMTYNLCGYYIQSFDYKNKVPISLPKIKLNTDFSMPLKFYIRLLSTSPIYINPQVLSQIYTSKPQSKLSNPLQCQQLGNLAITVSQCKAKLLMSSIQFQIFK